MIIEFTINNRFVDIDVKIGLVDLLADPCIFVIVTAKTGLLTLSNVSGCCALIYSILSIARVGSIRK